MHKLVSVFLCALILPGFGAPPPQKRETSTKALFQGPQIFLTVSPLASYRNSGGEIILYDRMLEIHWENLESLEENDTVVILNSNPLQINGSRFDDYILEAHEITEASGSFKSSVRYARRNLNPFIDHCLDFWVAHVHNENDQHSFGIFSCLEIHPSWMNDIKTEIGQIPLTSLMIPGTHNAGSWLHYAGSSSEGPVVGYTYCHEDSIYDQLIHGIRSLDVRVGYYPSIAEQFYINHDRLRIRPLRTLLEDVKKFVEETNEIILLDFHRFPVGLEDLEDHRKLVEYIESQIGDLLAPKSLSLSVTPEQLWQLNRTVVLFYSRPEMERENEFLWPGIEQAWGDTNKLDELESYLTSALTEFGCQRRAWSAMAQLTSTAEDIILRPFFGVRGFSNVSNNEVSKWYQRENWYSKSMIVALDYYRSTNVIETAIDVNRNQRNVCV